MRSCGGCANGGSWCCSPACARRQIWGPTTGARWIDPENYHLTLRFIGDVDAALARDIALLLGQVKRRSFELRFDGLAPFGGRRPRAVVAAIAPVSPLIELQAEHERLMQRIG